MVVQAQLRPARRAQRGAHGFFLLPTWVDFFAMAAIHEHGELDAFRPAKIRQRIHRRADRASTEQHIVHEDNGLSRHVKRDERGMNRRRSAMAEIVAVHIDVETAARDRRVPDL
jgi:hypothetical protein